MSGSGGTMSGKPSPCLTATRAKLSIDYRTENGRKQAIEKQRRFNQQKSTNDPGYVV